jgi:hypothetical protein
VIHKDDDDQARANMLKILRTAIRLKHSIAADEEMNDLLPKAQAKWDKAIQNGNRPEAIAIKTALGV